MDSLPSDFELKQSGIPGAGLGVFAKRAIPKDTFLALKPKDISVGVLRHEMDIPKDLIGYCVARENDTYQCPADFNNMEMVWYLNHSATPNAEQRGKSYYSISDIEPNEEVLIDYNIFGEPEDKKEDFYSS